MQQRERFRSDTYSHRALDCASLNHYSIKTTVYVEEKDKACEPCHECHHF